MDFLSYVIGFCDKQAVASDGMLLRMVSNPVISGQIGNMQTEKHDTTNGPEMAYLMINRQLWMINLVMKGCRY